MDPPVNAGSHAGVAGSDLLLQSVRSLLWRTVAGSLQHNLAIAEQTEGLEDAAVYAGTGSFACARIAPEEAILLELENLLPRDLAVVVLQVELHNLIHLGLDLQQPATESRGWVVWRWAVWRWGFGKPAGKPQGDHRAHAAQRVRIAAHPDGPPTARAR